MTVKPFGLLTDGRQAHLYKIRFGSLDAKITDFGATLVSLTVPDSQGNRADVVLSFDSAADCAASSAFLGATVGRNANRIAGASFSLNGKTHTLEKTTPATICTAVAIPMLSACGMSQSIPNSLFA